MKKQITFTLLALATLNIHAQGTVDDYKRAFSTGTRHSNKMTNGSINIRRSFDGPQDEFIYSTWNGDSTVWYKVDAKTGTKEQISNPEQNHRPRGNWGGVRSDGYHHWMEVRDEKDGRAESPVNKGMIMVHRDNNLYLQTNNDSLTKPTQVTFDGVDTCYYSSWGRWSKDGKYYATVLIKPAPKHYVTYTQSSPVNQVQPIYTTLEYAKPGDSLNYRIPVIIDVENKTTIYPKSTDLFKSQYEVSAPAWDENGKTLTFEFNERGHKTFRVLEMDLKGNVRTLIEEKNDKYVAYSRNLRRDLDENHILWKSDRDGHAHLYLYDRKKDKLTQVTKGDFWVREVQDAQIDEKGKGFIIFSANGLHCQNIGTVKSSFDGKIPEEDPYNIHYYRIDLDGKNFVELTPERGTHDATFSHSCETSFIDTYSSIDQPPVTVLRSSIDGHVISTLETANISRLEATGWQAPEVFVAPGRDGKTDMWGLIQRPSNFDPNKKYPVIEYIYSGPGDQYVPKKFTPWLYYLQDVAELGFIVVQLDAMTTSFRNLDFEQVCYKNLKDAGFPDRIEWIKAAAKKYPYMDLDRMGIYGCSAGGQEALGALLFHGDFYKAAYAACGCHDNRMDKIWWNEQWMGYPVDSSYIECSNVENAKNLKGKLMLLVGEMDDNVDPSSSYQVVNALIKANKDFEFILIPGAHHTMGENYGEHKRADFFVKNLLGVEPPSWEDLR
ncbi:MAG: prolyl oligopeptidase family serine peptidase [Bacteroidaceae bacterium]|nr:prolyl oligopeptidase family serine peptidase [Bacteroidaceae bacterium]